MLQRRFRIDYLLLLPCLLWVVGCTTVFDPEVKSEETSKTYLHFSMAGVELPNHTRAQGDLPSINSDTNEYEDYVRELAVMMYDATTGELYKQHFTTYQSFVIEIEPKAPDCHICFVANYPESWRNTLQGLRTYTDFTAALKGLTEFKSRDTGNELYDGASSESLFPMARIYENQTLPTGGTVSNPKPFTPTLPISKVLSPVSSWGESWEEGKTLSGVHLVRSAAKITLNIRVGGLKDITKIELHNVPSQHSYMEETKLSGILPTAKLFNGSDRLGSSTALTFNTQMYLPERLLGEATSSLGWNTTHDQPIGTPTYIQITMKSGRTYKIPVVTISKQATPGPTTTYLDIARNQEPSIKADYSIYRNNHYKYEIVVPVDNKELDLRYMLLPWTHVTSTMSYARPRYDFRLFDSNVAGDVPPSTHTPQTSIDQEVLLVDQTPATIYFKIDAPKGTFWQATITNGRDFKLEGKTQGIVGETDGWYRMTLTPRYPFESQPRYAQFYITLEGKEIYLGYKPASGGTGATLELDNRYIGDGTSAQWKFKQVMPSYTP